MSNQFRAILVLLLTMFFVAGSISAQSVTIKLGSGESGQQYDNFSETLKERFEEFEDVQIEVVNTTGSSENMSALRQGDLDAAIVQSDIAYTMSESMKEMNSAEKLQAVIELFPEYIQVIVRSDSGINSIGDLEGKEISVGALQSGTIRNAREILGAYGLGEDKYIAITDLSTEAGLADLNSENSKISAVIITGRFRHEYLPGRMEATGETGEQLPHKPVLRHIFLDQTALNDLTVHRRSETQEAAPYYIVRPNPASDPDYPNVLTVNAYLIVTNRLGDQEASAFIDRVFALWPEIRKSSEWRKQLPSLRDIFTRGPIEWHPRVRINLQNMGFLPNEDLNIWVMLIWGFLLLFSIYSLNRRAGYNRVGVSFSNQSGKTIEQYTINCMARIAPAFLGVTLFIALICISVVILRGSERNFVESTSGESRFLALSWWESFIWMFQYVASGFQGEAFAPKSDTGRLIAATVAIIGVLGPTTMIFYVINLLSASRVKKLNGHSEIHFTNHLVLCGWNEKGPGIVYSVTGDDVDTKVQVTIVADLEASPIEKYGFDQSHVSYIRGDATESSVLHRANADKASTAIILAGDQVHESEAMSSVLTAMNLSQINPDIHICAEVARAEDERLLLDSKCQSIIVPEKLVTKLATAAILDPLIIDFILDIITYHQFDEFYTADPATIKKATGQNFVGKTLRQIELEFLKRGTNVIGMIRPSESREGARTAMFDSGSSLVPLTNAEDSRLTLQLNDTLVYSGHTNNSLASRNHARRVTKAKELPASAFVMKKRTFDKILIVGHEDDAREVILSMEVFDPSIVVDTIPNNDDMDNINDNNDMEYSHITILVDRDERSLASDLDASNRIDAKTLILVRRIAAHYDKLNIRRPVFTAELLNINNRDVFLGAGIAAVLPTSLIIERLLVKEVYDANHIVDYLIALLNMHDGTHLSTIHIENDHPLIGESYHSLLKTEVNGLRIIGWLPIDQRKRLENTQSDFDWHFRTVLDNRLQQNRIKAGDILITIYNHEGFANSGSMLSA